MKPPVRDELRGVFCSYFHEDWVDEFETADDVIAQYLRDGRSHAEVSRIADLIEALVRETPDDDALDRIVNTDLDCNYLPSADGLSMRAWLAHVVTILRAASSS